MKNPNPEPEKCLVSEPRRNFLVRAQEIVKTIAYLALLLPLVKFISFTPPRKPNFVKVNRVIKSGGFIIESDFIMFDLDGEPIAVSRKCTHLGCKLNFNELENMLVCPCHLSRFDKRGNRLSGPARLDLPTFKVDKTGSADVTGYIVTIV